MTKPKNSTSSKKNSPDTLLLDGRTLNNDDSLQELVASFRTTITEKPDIPVVLDLTKVTALYSKGIAIVLGLFKDCKASNREFSIKIISDEIFNLLKMLKLDKVITIHKVEQ